MVAAIVNSIFIKISGDKLGGSKIVHKVIEEEEFAAVLDYTLGLIIATKKLSMREISWYSCT